MSNRKNVAEVARQIGGELLEDAKGWHNRFEIASKTSSRKYVIAQRDTDNTWGCSCPGWRHYRRCKHLTDVLRRLAGVAVSAVAATFDEATRALLSSARAALDMEESTKGIAVPTTKGRSVDVEF
jgi:hypothetical protein